MDNSKYCISLAGEWKLALDPDKEGILKAYYNKTLADEIILPGTTDEHKKGNLYETCEIERLTRTYSFQGYAWYQKVVAIGEEWRGKHVSLYLERTRISRVWIDGKDCGRQDSICTPHVYELGVVAPGSHNLTIMIDNTELPVAGGHQTSPDTQTNWNGILGRMELNACDPVWIEDIQAYPDPDKRTVILKIAVRNEAGARAPAHLTLSASSINTGREHHAESREYVINLREERVVSELEYFMGPDALLWDEYFPALYTLHTSLDIECGNSKYTDEKAIPFGMRKFSTHGTQFTNNGRTVFLRGKHDACVFPLTGYAPMEVEGWARVFEIAKSYGINHYRFHTCCPPEAGFIAADREGIYLEVELPYWGPYKEPEDKDYDVAQADYLVREAQRIMRSFGNHPSFVMFSLGNELSGSRKVLSAFIRDRRKEDGRYLYAEGSNNFISDPALLEEADFWVTMHTAHGEAMVRGSVSHYDQPLGHVQVGPPATTADYGKYISGVPVPVVGHEIGQYQSYPDFKEIGKYTGVLQAQNLKIFRDRLKAKGMLDKAEDFFRASGKLAVLCYREDIEAALRTPGFGGIQLLDLQDFPGQGTALVGILDSFMDSKGFITPEAWREFCSDTVLLACFPKYTYSADETFKADIKIAYYGAEDLKNIVLEWSLHSKDTVYSQGEFRRQELSRGTVELIGVVNTGLRDMNVPEKLTLDLKLKGTEVKNHYSIWVYPSEVDTSLPQGLSICRSADAARGLLEKGENVLLIPELTQNSNSIEGFFASDFWCYPMFRSMCENAGKTVAPGTLGLLCEHHHPAMGEFPSGFHSDWQWWHIVMNSRSMILDNTPVGFYPIVQVIDNFERNHKLGLIFEARSGKGKLLVCGSDLLSHRDKPEVRQLLYSILRYMASAGFEPQYELRLEDILGESEGEGQS